MDYKVDGVSLSDAQKGFGDIEGRYEVAGFLGSEVFFLFLFGFFER